MSDNFHGLSPDFSTNLRRRNRPDKMSFNFPKFSGHQSAVEGWLTYQLFYSMPPSKRQTSPIAAQMAEDLRIKLFHSINNLSLYVAMSRPLLQGPLIKTIFFCTIKDFAFPGSTDHLL